MFSWLDTLFIAIMMTLSVGGTLYFNFSLIIFFTWYQYMVVNLDDSFSQLNIAFQTRMFAFMYSYYDILSVRENTFDCLLLNNDIDFGESLSATCASPSDNKHTWFNLYFISDCTLHCSYRPTHSCSQATV